MDDPSVDRVRVDVESTTYREASVEIGDDLAFRVAECAADVHVCGGVGGDEARIISSPGSRDFGDWGSGRTRARVNDGGCENARELEDAHPRHD